MNNLNVMRRNGGEGILMLDAFRLKRGMPVRLNDGRSGKVHSVAGDDVHVDLSGPNPHLTGVVLKRAYVKIRDGVVVDDLAARLGHAKVSKSNREQRPAVVVDPGRARLEAEWKDAPED